MLRCCVILCYLLSFVLFFVLFFVPFVMLFFFAVTSSTVVSSSEMDGAEDHRTRELRTRADIEIEMLVRGFDFCRSSVHLLLLLLFLYSYLLFVLFLLFCDYW